MIKKIQHSAGGIVLNHKGEIALVSQHPSGKSWSFPKGHIERDEKEVEAAKREIYEETGIRVLDFIKDLGSYKRYALNDESKDDQNKPKIIHLFLFSTTQVELKAIDNNIYDAKWFKKEKVAKKLNSAQDREYFLKIIKTI